MVNKIKNLFFRIVKRPKTIFFLLIIMSLIGIYVLRIDKLEFYNKYHREIQIVKKISNVLYLPQMLARTKIDRYDLVIDQEDWDFLNTNLPPVYASSILVDEYKKTVKAKFIINDREYDVKVRYRGDTDVHWRDPKKSWLIDFKKDDYFENKEEIHLIIPVDRYYILEELSFYRARKMGLTVPESKFVNFFVNGKRQGIYWEIEGWEKDLLEKQNIPGDINFYGGVDFVQRVSPDEEAFSSVHTFKKYSKDLLSDSDSYTDLDSLMNLINHDSDEYFNKHIEDLVDMESFYKWLVHQNLLTSSHQGGSNLRFYFDSTKGKFVFMPWDISIYDAPPPLLEEKYNRLITRVLKNPEFLHERNELLWEYINDDSNLKDDLDFYDELDKLTKSDFYRDYRKVESNLAYRKQVNYIREQIINRFDYFKDNFKNANAVVTVEVENDQPLAKVTVGTSGYSSILLTEVEIKKDSCDSTIELWQDSNDNDIFDSPDQKFSTLACNDGEYKNDHVDFIIYSKKEEDENYLKPGYNESSFFIYSNKIEDLSTFNEKDLDFTIRNAITGKKVKDFLTRYINKNLNINLESISQTAEEFVKENPIFNLMNGNIILKSGSHVIYKDLIIPKNSKFIIQPGTTILMSDGSSILSYSPIEALGTISQPIRFLGLNGAKWGVLGVIGVESVSTFEHISMDNGSEDFINGVFMSGMFSAYHSSIVIKNSEFKRANGDDAVNIKYGQSEIFDSKFLNNSFDALDIDISNALVVGNVFDGNGNDGIDISAGQPLIKNNIIQNSGDKCISIGENSKAIVFNNFLSNCKIGIAVKDYSQPLIINNVIINNNIGIAGYQKKEIFGGSDTKVVNSIVWGNDKSIDLDSKSTIEISYSNVENNSSGEGNVEIKPEFRGLYFLDKDSQLQTLGNKGQLNSIEEIDIDVVPIGLIESIFIAEQSE